MTKKEKERLLEAYNHFAEGCNKLEEFEFLGKKEHGVRMSKEDLEILKPFLFARVEKSYTVGETTLKARSGSCFWIGENDDGGYLCSYNAFFEAYTDLYTMIKLAISSRLASKHFYTEGGNGSD